MGQTVNLLAYAFGGSNPSLPTKNCGSSSVDRALAFQAEGRGFEPRLPLYEENLRNWILFFCFTLDHIIMKEPQAQNHVLRLAHPPIPTVHIGIIGLGNRGLLTLQRYLQIEGVEIKALSEIREGNLHKAQLLLREAGRPEAAGYTGTDGWKKMCESDGLDMVFICTDWLMHTPMATFAMECNKHVAIEVPAAMSVDECWQLVDTAERTRRHCIMLENCCYDPFALTTLNMARRGILGEIMHVEGAYIHDLRSMYFAEENEGGYHNHWGKRYSIEHTGNPYPTHGLGPACQILDIHRCDRMEYLVSMSTHQAGMSEYARRMFGEYSPEACQKYKLGDVNTTLIHTVKGKTIMLQYSVSIPRPYSRLQTVCGTLGFAQKYPVPCIALDPDGSTPLDGERLEKIMARYRHPFSATIGEEAHRKGVPNEMNYVMDYRLIYCLRNGLPLDMDVYDAAEWSCVTELSEKSVLNGSMPMQIPDFTRGAWKQTK